MIPVSRPRKLYSHVRVLHLYRAQQSHRPHKTSKLESNLMKPTRAPTSFHWWQMLGPANSSHRALGHKLLGSAFPWATKQATGEGVGPGWGPLSTKAEVTQELTFHSARGRLRTDGISVMQKLAVQEGKCI